MIHRTLIRFAAGVFAYAALTTPTRAQAQSECACNYTLKNPPAGGADGYHIAFFSDAGFTISQTFLCPPSFSVCAGYVPFSGATVNNSGVDYATPVLSDGGSTVLEPGEQSHVGVATTNTGDAGSCACAQISSSFWTLSGVAQPENLPTIAGADPPGGPTNVVNRVTVYSEPDGGPVLAQYYTAQFTANTSVTLVNEIAGSPPIYASYSQATSSAAVPLAMLNAEGVVQAGLSFGPESAIISVAPPSSSSSSSCSGVCCSGGCPPPGAPAAPPWALFGLATTLIAGGMFFIRGLSKTRA